MDDAPDGAYSRAPEVEDLLALCRALNHEHVRYVLIGGFAVILHRFVRTTKNINLLVDPSETNVRAIKRALATLPDNAAAQVDDADVRRHAVVRVADEIVVDLMASACGVTSADVSPDEIDHRLIDGVDPPLAGMRLLFRMKDTVRDSDKVDV